MISLSSILCRYTEVTPSVGMAKLALDDVDGTRSRAISTGWACPELWTAAEAAVGRNKQRRRVDTPPATAWTKSVSHLTTYRAFEQARRYESEPSATLPQTLPPEPGGHRPVSRAR